MPYECSLRINIVAIMSFTGDKRFFFGVGLGVVVVCGVVEVIVDKNALTLSTTGVPRSKIRS